MLNTLFKSKKPGFSILEIVVVIVVIAFFAMLIIPGLISGPSRARDATRKKDLKVIQSSLESYFGENNSYPTNLTDLEKGGAAFIKKVPTDPKTGAAYVYITTGNPPSSYVLEATLENKNDKDLKTTGSDPAKGLFKIFSFN